MSDAYNGKSNWLAEDMKELGEWCLQLNNEQIQSIERALRSAQEAGETLESLTKESFPLPELRGLFDETLERLENGRGIVVVRGLPALQYTKDELRMIYWGIGMHIGIAMSQSSKGDMLGDVRDFGQDVYSSKGRGYMSKQHLGFHSDSADLVCLMVLRQGISGGLSKICSSVAVRNEIARTRPDLLEELYKPFYWSWKGQEALGEKPYYQQPIFSEYEGKFCCRHIITHVLAGYEDFPELVMLTEKQLEALWLVNTTADDPRFHFSMMFEPGDMQFLNNHVTMHSRSEFQDGTTENEIRHLLRMWIAPPNSRNLHPLMAEFYGNTTGGEARGGFPSRTGTRSFETVAAKD